MKTKKILENVVGGVIALIWCGIILNPIVVYFLALLSNGFTKWVNANLYKWNVLLFKGLPLARKRHLSNYPALISTDEQVRIAKEYGIEIFAKSMATKEWDFESERAFESLVRTQRIELIKSFLIKKDAELNDQQLHLLDEHQCDELFSWLALRQDIPFWILEKESWRGTYWSPDVETAIKKVVLAISERNKRKIIEESNEEYLVDFVSKCGKLSEEAQMILLGRASLEAFKTYQMEYGFKGSVMVKKLSKDDSQFAKEAWLCFFGDGEELDDNSYVIFQQGCHYQLYTKKAK